VLAKTNEDMVISTLTKLNETTYLRIILLTAFNLIFFTFSLLNRSCFIVK
jgi:hypothetical protein